MSKTVKRKMSWCFTISVLFSLFVIAVITIPLISFIYSSLDWYELMNSTGHQMEQLDRHSSWQSLPVGQVFMGSGEHVLHGMTTPVHPQASSLFLHIWEQVEAILDHIQGVQNQWLCTD